MAHLSEIKLSGYENIQISNTFVSAMLALEDFKLPSTICSDESICLHSPPRSYSNPDLIQLLAQTQGIVLTLGWVLIIAILKSNRPIRNVEKLMI